MLNLTKKQKAVSFVLPTVSYVPNGGFKIIYEYANRLLKLGYKVNLIHPNIVDSNEEMKVSKGALQSIKYYKRKLFQRRFTGNWFPIDNNINSYFVREIKEKYIPDSDIIIASAWQTAKPVLSLSDKKGIKFYFIQSLEKWAGPEREVIETWMYPMHKIVISKWLLDFAFSLNEVAHYIPNGLDFTKFNLDIKPENKRKKSILMLASNFEVKGTKYGLEIVHRLKKVYPDIDVTLFGADNYKEHLPDWIKFYLKPSQSVLRDLYNSSSIFLSPSLMEGFPLPPAESMMCGCALVATDIGGHREYAVNEKNSVLFPPKDVNKATDLIKFLIENNSLRISLAYQGNKDIQIYRWDDSVKKMSDLFDTFVF